jgi:hypothetical protein
MANTPQPLPTFERIFIRPILRIIWPKLYRSKIMKIKMRVKLYFSPIKYIFHKGGVEVGSRLCVFVSYQPNGILSTTWKYLRHLKEELGYSIVLVSNCPLQKNDIPALQNLCLEVIERDNIGYDFGAYKDGILRYMEKLGSKFDELETLLIANDSVIGPIYDMSPMHAQMQAEDCDFWGMNDAYAHLTTDISCITDVVSYVCSYFIVFKNPLIKTNCFKQFWRAAAYVSNKYYAIYYEKTLTQYFVRNRFKCSAFIKKEDIATWIISQENFKCELWFSRDCTYQASKIWRNVHSIFDVLDYEHTNSSCPMLTLVHFGMPLMKRDLIKRDVVNVNIFKAILNMHEKQLTGIVTKEEILDEIGLNPRTANSIFKWKKYII